MKFFSWHFENVFSTEFEWYCVNFHNQANKRSLTRKNIAVIEKKDDIFFQKLTFATQVVIIILRIKFCLSFSLSFDEKDL